MGQGEVVQTQQNVEVEIEEGGDIFFLYRPRVDESEPQSIDDIQRFFLILHPVSSKKETGIKQTPDAALKEGKVDVGIAANPTGDSVENSKESVKSAEEVKEEQKGTEEGQGTEEIKVAEEDLWRIMVIGRKHLPPVDSRTRPYWGYVELVTKSIEDVKRAISGGVVETNTRGERHQPGARGVGEGVYRILKHTNGSRKDTHLVYRLEYPEEDKEKSPQEALNISREASYILQIKNPEAATAQAGLSKKRRATFPARLQGLIGSRRFIGCDPPDFLNYEGCEFLLISGSDDIEEELGLELKGEEGKECPDFLQQLGEPAAKGKREKPLFEGVWA